MTLAYKTHHAPKPSERFGSVSSSFAHPEFNASAYVEFNAPALAFS
jgi:hypothetical protein